MIDNNNEISSVNASKEVSDFGIDIVKSFHEQFAQNQNHHQALFIQALTVLVTVLIGFGYVYIRAKINPIKPESEVNVTVDMLYWFLALACLLLSFGIALISNMALGFRRDQAVAANIRVLWGVMPQPQYPEQDRGFEGLDFFPAGFNPVRKTEFFFWMPEFHQIFLATLFIVKVAIVFSLLVHPDFHKAVWPLATTKSFACLACLVVILTFSIDWVVVNWYWGKWKKTAEAAPPRLKTRSVTSPLPWLLGDPDLTHRTKDT